MLKVKRLRLLISLLSVLCFAPAFATVVPHLYDVTLTAESQSQEEWQKLVKQGLTQVLEKISTSPNMSTHPQVKQALDRSAEFVEQFSYEGNQITIKYSPEMVNQLVQRMGQAVWGQRRPTVVLWLAIEDNQQRRLVGVETDPSLQNYLTNLATKKGIPLVLPLMDLEDMSAITVTDVWGQFPSVLQQASMRYGAQTILIGRVMRTSNEKGFEANWQLVGGDTPNWNSAGQTLEAVLDQGMEGVSRYLKTQATVQTTSRFGVSRGQPFLIAVEGITSSRDFTNVEAYLKKLDPVKEVNIHQLLGAIAVFEITLKNDIGRHALEQTLTMDQHLIPSLAKHHDIAKIESSYRWVGVAADMKPASVVDQMDTPDTSPLWEEGDD